MVDLDSRSAAPPDGAGRVVPDSSTAGPEWRFTPRDSSGSEGTDPGGERRLLARTGLVLLLGFALLVPLTPSGLPNGDAAVYAQQIAKKSFADRPVHMGYYVVGAALLGFSDDFSDRTLNLLSAIFAAATLALIFHATATVTGSPVLALAAAACLLGHLPFLRNGVLAEIYMMQSFFLLLAFWLFWRWGEKVVAAVASGLALAGSVLVTPSSLLAVPALVAGRPRWRPVVWVGLAGGALTLGAVATVWQEYFWGDRGLMAASGTRLSLKQAVVKEGFELTYAVGALLPFLALGGLGLLTRSREGRSRQGGDRGRAFLLVLAALWLPTFLLAERFRDVPVQLPTWILLAPLMAVGGAELGRRLAAVGVGRRYLVLVAAVALGSFSTAALPFVRGEAESFAGLPGRLEWLLAALLAIAGVAAAVLVRARPRRASWVLWAGCLLVNLCLSLAWIERERDEIESYREAVLSVEAESGERFLVVGPWSRGILFEHYLYRSSYTTRWVNTAWLHGIWGDEWQRKAEGYLQRGIDYGWPIYFLPPRSDVEPEMERLEALGWSLEPTHELPGFGTLWRSRPPWGRAAAEPPGDRP
ncbi:MAG: hypothetical protein MI919_07015 [Holophagales bacterium]|nr:hypothetical protein [Holophagales bacterium]